MKSIKKILLDLIFPIRCLGCGAWDLWLCPKCQTKIINSKKIVFSGQSLKVLYYLDSYQNPLLAKIIHQFKYAYSKEIAGILSPLLNSLIDQPFDYLVPVPLHRRRFLERGFNQSYLLAKNINLPLLENTLLRNKYTPPQVTLDEKNRRENVKNCFVLNPKNSKKIIDKKILLLDDVYTTGATLNACAKTLKQGQAQEVWALVVAKG